MTRRRSLAVLALMVILTLAPSLALVASVCAPHCCPGAAVVGTGETDDCRAGFANRTCCNEAVAPTPLVAPPVAEAPALPGPVVFVASDRPEPRLLSPVRSEATLALRTSPLRLSVVLLI